MSVSAISPCAPHRTTFYRRKRARRFWSAVAVVLRETGNPKGEASSEESKNFTVRSVPYEASWRLPAAA